MLFSILTVIQGAVLCHGLLCSKTTCYGTLQETQQVKHESSVTFFLKPDNARGGAENIIWDGQNLYCGNSVTSDVSAPLHIPAGMTLLPSCSERQTIRRTSRPSEQVRPDRSFLLARSSVEEGYTPCDILVLESENVSVRHFNLDNSLCLNHSSSWHFLPKYLSSSVVLISTKPEIRNLHLEDLHNKAGVLMYISGRSTLHPSRVQNISLADLHNGEILVEMVTGNITIDESVDLTSFCLGCSSHNNIEKFLGPLALSELYHEKQQQIMANESKFAVIICTFLLTVCIALIATSSSSCAEDEVSESQK